MKHLLLWQILAVRNILEAFFAEVQLPVCSLSAQLKVCCQMRAFLRRKCLCWQCGFVTKQRFVCARTYAILQVKYASWVEMTEGYELLLGTDAIALSLPS